ncbi:MAG: hypothetical protein ACYDH4_10910 [Candidatus Cryosericum sp.]
MKLNPEPSRNLTVREVTELLSGQVGVALSMADRQTVSDAVDWLHEHKNALLDILEGPKSPTWLKDP